MASNFWIALGLSKNLKLFLVGKFYLKRAVQKAGYTEVAPEIRKVLSEAKEIEIGQLRIC